jgi:hypothetical protein
VTFLAFHNQLSTAVLAVVTEEGGFTAFGAVDLK